MRKRPEDVRGYIINCPRYHKCPVCYGCRNFDASLVSCLKCAANAKKNICDTYKHQSEKIAKLLSRKEINF